MTDRPGHAPQDAARSRLAEIWCDVDVPSISRFAEVLGPLGDDDVDELIHDDLQARESHRLSVRVEDYAAAIDGLEANERACEAIFAHEILADAPDDPSAWARARTTALPHLAKLIERARDAVGDFGDPEILGDHYRVVEELGRGGFGRVVRARDLRTGEMIAVKALQLPPPGRRRQDAIQRFRRESSALERLDHPSIVARRELSLDATPPHFAMRLVEGRDLEFWMRREKRWRMTHPEADPDHERRWVEKGVRLIIAAARAVHAAHEKSVLHRDLKPGNIVVSADDHVTLIDFGLAGITDETTEGDEARLTATLEFRGTPAYVAPESIPSGGRRIESERTDVYVLGAVLYGWLTLRDPFSGESPNEVLDAVRRDDPTDVRKLNEAVRGDLDLILRRAMAKSPNDRYVSAAALADDLERHLAGERPLVRPFGIGHRIATFYRRDPRFAIALTSAFAASLIGTVVSLRFALDSQASEKVAKSETSRADDAARKSNEDAERARESAAAAREALAEQLKSRLAAAQARGDWRDYLALSEDVVDDDAVSAEIRMTRVLAASIINRRDVVDRELAKIREMELPPRMQARLDLAEGEVLILEEAKEVEAVNPIKRAVASGHLDPADEWYAKGLIAPTTTEAVSAFKEGIQADTSHRGCRAGLSISLTLIGDVENSKLEADAIGALFPLDPFPAMVQGFNSVTTRNEGDRRRAVDKLRRICGDAAGDAASGVFEAMP